VVRSALQREYPFDDVDTGYDGAVPEPIDESDLTCASGLTLPELVQVQAVAAVVRRALEKHADDPRKLAAVRALLRSTVG
jgi:hypothetical protein